MDIKKRGGKFRLNKRSQAAIFLIGSLVIILLGLLYFFYQKQSAEKQLEIVQPEAAPIKLFVEDCIRQVSQDGLERMGIRAGYISIPAGIANDPRAYLKNSPSPSFKVPYWWHDGIEAVPTLGYLQQQLQEHVRSQLNGCINNFGAFADKYEINALKEPVVSVGFNDNDVGIDVDYQIEIVSKNGNFKQLLEKFHYTIPVRFKKVYELAKLVMDRENADKFLEKKTIDLYSMGTEIPTTEVEATCNTKVWQLSSIRDVLKNLLRVNLPYIRIKGTDYNPSLYVPNPDGASTYSNSYFQQHYVWEVDENPAKKYGTMKVSFSYDSWPLSMYSRPSENGIMRSNMQKGADLLSFFCLQVSHFTYDVDYPVMVTIFDEETASNSAYQFSFPFRVSVDHNQPSRAYKGSVLFESAADLSSDEYCSSTQNGITIFTVDNSTGDDIRGVNLTFVCGRFYCNMGQTDWISLGAAAGLTKSYPYCVNGVIKGSKDGYAESSSFIQTDVDGKSYVLMMNPVKKFSGFKVVKHLLSNPGPSMDLESNEKVSIQIKGKDNGFEGFAVYPIDANFPLQIPYKDGTYEVTIYITDDQNILGGYDGEWKVSKDGLINAEQVVFHVLEQGPASDDDKALFLSGLASYSKSIPAPELK